MMEALSQINEMVSKLEKRMVEIHSNKAEENKHPLYPFTNNAGMLFTCMHTQSVYILTYSNY